MTNEEKRAYSKGYNAGKANRWNDNCPPEPPNQVVRGLMVALKEIRDFADGCFASFGEDDEMNLAAGPYIARADAALEAVTEWLRKCQVGNPLSGVGTG